MLVLLMLLGCVKELKNEVIYKGKDLIQAAEEVDKDKITRLLEEGENVNEADLNGITPLYIASQEGNKEIVELLLSKGASIDLAMNDRSTPLFIASYQGHKEVVELLLTKGASIDLATIDGWKPLFIASRQGHKEVVELLLSKGASINLGMNNGATPLFIASQEGKKEVAELLLSKGASIDLGNKNGETPLFIASYQGHKEVVDLLLSKGAAIDLGNKNGATPLFIASQEGNKEVVELLLSKGAAIDLACEYETTPLYIASQEGNKEVVELLLSKGASIDKEVGARTALYVSSAKGNKEVVELLITKGAEIDKVAGRYGTALYVAGLMGHKEIVELLLSRGAEIDKEIDERTALYIASSNGHTEVVELLLAKGAKIDKEVYGRTALSIASSNGQKEVVDVLITKGAKIDKELYGRTALYEASYYGQKEVVELLLAKGAVIDKEVYGKTALLIAIYYGQKEVVDVLITKGAKIDKETISGMTPLIMTKLLKKDEIFKLLLSKVENSNSLSDDAIEELIYRTKDIEKKVNDLLIKELEIFKKNKNDLSKDLIIALSLKLKDSSLCLYSGILLNNDSMETYQKLSNCLPFSYIQDNLMNISKLNKYGYTGLHFAILQDNTENLKNLLKNKELKEYINTNQNEKNESCVSLALRLNKIEHIKILLSFCASPVYFSVRTKSGGVKGSYTQEQNVLEDERIIRQYVSDKMLFDVLEDKRLEDAVKLINPNVVSEHKLKSEINNFDYTKVINLKTKDSGGKNIFHYLAIHGNGIDVSEFLNKSFDLKSFSKELLFEYDKDGLTPFHYAIRHSNDSFVEYFLANGNIIDKVDIDKKTKDGKSIFNLVEDYSAKEIVTLLIKYMWSNNDIETFYQSAKVQEADKNMYRFVKESGSEDETVSEESINAFNNLNLGEKDLIRAIHLSIVLNAHKCLKAILVKIPKNKLEKLVTFKILEKVCSENKEEILGILLMGNENKLLEKDKDDNTLLHLACKENKSKIAEKLLNYENIKNNINAKNKYGNTAMHYANLSLSPHLVTTLKQAGSNPKEMNNNGDRGIDLLKTRQTKGPEHDLKIGTMYASLCALLGKEYNPDNRELILHLALEANEDWIISDFCVRGIGIIKKEDEEGNVSLHLAIDRDKTKAVEILLKDGASFIEKNNRREKAIESVKSKEVLELIINNALEIHQTKSKALLNEVYENKNTLLQLAINRAKINKLEDKKTIEEKDKDLLKAMLSNGADTNITNNDEIKLIKLMEENVEAFDEILAFDPKLGLEAMEERERKYWEEETKKDKKKEIERKEEEQIKAIFNGELREDIELISKRKAIHVIVQQNRRHELLILLDKKCNPEEIDYSEEGKGRNCYEIALDRVNMDVFEELIKQSNVLKETKRPSIFYLVAEKGSNFIGGKYFEVVLKKLKTECSQNTLNWEEVSKLDKDPVEAIIGNDDSEMLEKIMELGLRIKYGAKNILLNAILNSRKKIITLLIKKLREESTKPENPLMMDIIEYRNSEDSSNMLHIIIRNSGKDDGFNSKLEEVFREILKKIDLNELTYQDNYGDEKRGNSSVFNLCLEEPKFRWLESMIDSLLERKETGKKSIEQDQKMSNDILDKIVDLSRMKRHKHIKEIVRYFDEDIYNFFGTEYAKDKENIVAKFMYALADKSGNEEIIKHLLRIFHQNLYNKWDIYKDRYKGALPDIGTEIIKLGLGFVPVIGKGISLLAAIAKPALQEKFQSELKEKYGAIKKISEIYINGSWAEEMQFEEGMLRFFQDHQNIFEASNSNRILERLFKEDEKEKIEKCSDYLLLESSNLWTLVEEVKAVSNGNEEVKEKLKEVLKDIFNEIDKYNDDVKEYQKLLSDLIVKVGKPKILSKEALKVAQNTISRKNKESITEAEGKEFMKKYNELMRKRSNLANLACKKYELTKKGSKETLV